MNELLQEGDLIADGFNEAIIGVGLFENGLRRVIYSANKCIEILMRDSIVDGEETLSEDDAYEYFEFNVSGSYVGEKTPIYIWENDTYINTN